MRFLKVWDGEKFIPKIVKVDFGYDFNSFEHWIATTNPKDNKRYYFVLRIVKLISKFLSIFNKEFESAILITIKILSFLYPKGVEKKVWLDKRMKFILVFIFGLSVFIFKYIF